MLFSLCVSKLYSSFQDQELGAYLEADLNWEAAHGWHWLH